jgi:uncharacterized protein (TIGR01777 family)
MRIVIAGGTGFIGKAMLAAYRAEHTLEVLTRDPDTAQARLPKGVLAVGWDGATLGAWADRLDGADAVINLVGESIAQRWTPAVKQRLWDSRVKTTELLVQAAQRASTPPRIWLQASAIGVYDQSPDTTADESSPPASGFLADLGVAWEAAAQPVASLGARLCYMRIGVVLGLESGALPQMLTPFKLGVGGPIGSGKQWLSWVHLTMWSARRRFCSRGTTCRARSTSLRRSLPRWTSSPRRWGACCCVPRLSARPRSPCA